MKHYLKGSRFFQIFRVSDSTSDFKKPYTRIIESVGFPVILKYNIERIEAGKAVSIIERKRAEISVEIRENRDHGRRRKDLSDLMEDADRELEMAREKRSGIFRMSLAFKILSDKPYDLTENSEKLKLYTEMSHMNIFESSDRHSVKAFVHPDHGYRDYIADGFTASYFMPVFFSRPMQSGTPIGIEMINRRPYLFDPFTSPSHNVLVIGQTGSGKSFFVKLLAMRSNGSRIVILDPLNEYFCQESDKECVEISMGEGDYVDFISSIGDDGESISLAASVLSAVLNCD
ncbi:MAG: helicase HerA domain-containing protein, partial [Thermoplasmata archaeon]